MVAFCASALGKTSDGGVSGSFISGAGTWAWSAVGTDRTSAIDSDIVLASRDQNTNRVAPSGIT
jgi:hypothetical protein